MKFISHYSSSHGNLYEIQTVDGRLLIECGVSITKLKKALDYDLSYIYGCIVSHGHKDHCESMFKVMGEGIDVYTNFTHNKGMRRHHDIDAHMQIRPFHVHAFPLCHDVACMGFIVMHDSETLLFCTDTRTIPQAFRIPFDIIAIEANYYDDLLDYQVQTGKYPDFVAKRIRKNHMNIDETKRYLTGHDQDTGEQYCDLSRCREIHLLHMSEIVEREDVIKELSKYFIGIKVL